MIKFLKEEPNSSIVKIAEKKKKKCLLSFLYIHVFIYFLFILNLEIQTELKYPKYKLLF